MCEVKLTIFGTGRAMCQMTGKWGDGLTVAFEGDTARNEFLTFETLMRFVQRKLGEVERTLPDGVLPMISNGDGSYTQGDRLIHANGTTEKVYISQTTSVSHGGHAPKK